MRSYYYVLLVFIFNVAHGSPTPTFTQALHLAQTLKDQPQHAAASFHPKTQLKGYTSDPSQTKYYRGITQVSDNGLQTDANSDQSVAKRSITTAFDKRPVFTVNQQSDAMQKGKLIEGDAGNIARGILDKYVNCQQARVCHTMQKTKVCNEETRFITQRCIKTPEVHVLRVSKKAPNCRHLITRDYYAGAPKGGQYIGPWYPCVYAGLQTHCKKLYLVPGSAANLCVVSAVSVKGYTASKQGSTGRVPAGFPITLRIQDHGGISGRYGTDVNTGQASLSTGASVHLRYGATNTSTLLDPFSSDTKVSVRVNVWNTDNYSGPQIGLATIEVPAHITTKKTDVQWQEHCHA